MSRNYLLTLKVKGIAPGRVKMFIETEFNTSIDIDYGFDYKKNIKTMVLEGQTEVCLCGGMTENEAHDKIAEHFKSINPKALINTQWTDLENLPYDEYGDDFLENDEG